MTKIKISASRLNQIIKESIEESLMGIEGGFNAAKNNFKDNKGQSLGNRLMNAANAGNKGYRINNFVNTLYDLKDEAKQLRDAGVISQEQYQKIVDNLGDMRYAIRGEAAKGGINTYPKPIGIEYNGSEEYFNK